MYPVVTKLLGNFTQRCRFQIMQAAHFCLLEAQPGAANSGDCNCRGALTSKVPLGPPPPHTQPAEQIFFRGIGNSQYFIWLCRLWIPTSLRSALSTILTSQITAFATRKSHFIKWWFLGKMQLIVHLPLRWHFRLSVMCHTPRKIQISREPQFACPSLWHQFLINRCVLCFDIYRATKTVYTAYNFPCGIINVSESECCKYAVK